MLALRRVFPAGLLAATLLFTTACASDDDAASDPVDDTTDVDDAEEEADGADLDDPGADDDDVSADDAAADGDGAEFPVTVEHAGGETTLDEPAEAIFSLSPTTTELLFGIGAGDQVLAADVYSTYPEEAPTTEMSGFDPNIEAIAEYDADLVIVTSDSNEIVAGLTELGIPVLIHPSATSLDDVYGQIETLGLVTGNTDGAQELADHIEQRLDELTASAPDGASELSYYHEISETHHTATSETFIGQLYGLLGLENIADAAPDAGDAGGYPQLSAEYIIEADPDLIFLSHPQADGALAERPGWDQLTAVETGSVIELDPDVASRWGPRIVEQVETVVAAIESRAEAVDAS